MTKTEKDIKDVLLGEHMRKLKTTKRSISVQPTHRIPKALVVKESEGSATSPRSRDNGLSMVFIKKLLEDGHRIAYDPEDQELIDGPEK